MSLEENLDRVLARHQELQDLMASAEPPSPEEFARLSKEFSDLAPVVEAISELRRVKGETADLASLIADPETDAEMKDLAEEEFAQLKGKIPELEEKLQVMLLPKDLADDKNAILEIRAGTGGDGCRDARGRGGRYQGRGKGPAHRRLPGVGPRRAVGQHDG